MVETSPRLDPRLVAVVFALDDPGEPIAEIWRRASAHAAELGACRPGYDTVRRLVHVHRRRRREIDRLLEPVISDLLAGRMTLWDLDRALQAAAIVRAERAAGRRGASSM